VSTHPITGAMILPTDVLIIPVPELSELDRARISANDDEFAVSRRHGRSHSKILSSRAAAILERFRTATPIAEVLAEYSEEHDLDPQELLREAYPFLRACIAARLLVPADSPRSSRIVPILVPGDRVDNAEIVRCVHVMEDVEVCQARHEQHGIIAIKMLRPEWAESFGAAFKREAEMLSTLGGEGAPPLVERGVFENRPYLALGWCPGVSPSVVSAELRTQDAPDRDKRLLRLGRSILEAYVALHERAVAHGDVHPGNLLVDGAGVARILDFGFARVDRDDQNARPVPRAGVSYYFDPEYAAARRGGTLPPPVTRLAEQYSIASMLYFLLAGRHTRDFPGEANEMLRQIAEEPALPFSQHGVAPWPEAERVIGKGLAKDPRDRFGSTTEFLEAWNEISPRRQVRASERSTDRSRLDRFAGEVLKKVEVGGELWSRGLARAPACSLSLGATGIAYALYRLACLRDSPTLLFQADAWLTRAGAEMGQPNAFYDESDLTIETLGRTSPYHTESGIHAVRALISQAMGDAHAARAAGDRFVASSNGQTDKLDVWLGQAGTLLACAQLHRALGAAGIGAPGIVAFGERILGELGGTVETLGPVRDCPGLPNYGMAHGWAGLAFAAMRWCKAVGRPPDWWIGLRLEQLAECAEPCGRGVRWPWRDKLPGPGSRRQYAPGWCNGSAGFVHCWTLAGELFDRDDYLELAEQAAWNAWESPAPTAHLCCGHAGRAYALLNLYSRSGDSAWRSRAETLAARAVARRHMLRQGSDAKWVDRSLYRGEVGMALLAAELETPEVACMPFFGDEGWPGPEREPV
jgi:serine/threonine-protein kinase